MAYKQPLSVRIKTKAKSLWRDLVYDWKYGAYKNPDKPPGFLARAFRKALLASAALSVFSLGVALIGGNWAERVYRNIHGDPHKLDLTLDTGRIDNTAAPLFVGSSEATRIVAMQEDLLTLNIPLGACGANGAFTKQDLAAVKWFEAAVGLPQGDFVDDRALKALADQAQRRRALQGEFSEASTPQATLVRSFVNPSLAEKARIRVVEADLQALGYKLSACGVDGVLDDQDVASIMQFQAKQPGMIPTGAVDYKTFTAIKAAALKMAQDSGLLQAGAEQGLDDMSALINGAQMSPQELNLLARKYVQKGAPEYVVQAVADATLKAGFDFSYIMDIAYSESGYKPWVGADTSSAYGNFQFTDSTWRTVFKTYGAKYGYGSLTQKISSDYSHINAAPAESAYIMNLRNDPKVAALMAIELSKANLAYLQSNLGGAVGKTDLYIAHFLGPGGGLKFVKEFRHDNTQNAAAMFPKEAEKNKEVFYRDGQKATQPRSLGEIYANFSRHITGGQVLRMVAPQAQTRLVATAAFVRWPSA